MIYLSKAHTLPTKFELRAPSVPAVRDVYLTQLPVAQALEPPVFSFRDLPAQEGRDYKLIGYDKVQTLVGIPGTWYFNMFFNQKFSVKVGQSKYFRIYQGGNNVQLMLQRATDRSYITSLNETSWANTWQTMGFIYYANGFFEWYWQNIRKWAGWPGGQPVMPFIRLASAGIIEIDTGQSGLTPPAGYTWLEPE